MGKTRTLALSAMLIALALGLSYMERFLPLQLLIPLPGVKLGLANIVTLFALYFLGGKSAVQILVIRCALGAMFGGGLTGGRHYHGNEKGRSSQLRPHGVKVVWDMRVFLYCRVAHDDSFALEHQRFLLQLYAKQAGYTIIGAADEYGSGLTLDRPALQKVTEAVVAGRVDVVLVHSLTRIGRKWGMTQSYIDLLTRHKVKLLCIRDRLLFDENGAAPILTIKNAECH